MLENAQVLSAGNCHDDMELITWAKPSTKILSYRLVHENLDMLPDFILFVDDAKANAWELSVEIREKLC